MSANSCYREKIFASVRAPLPCRLLLLSETALSGLWTPRADDEADDGWSDPLASWTFAHLMRTLP